MKSNGILQLFLKISKAIGKAEFKKNYIKIFLSYLDDAEPEVSSISCNNKWVLEILLVLMEIWNS